MMKSSTETRIPLSANIQAAWQDVDSSFERFCLTAGLGAIEQMLCDDARQLTGVPYGRGEDRVGYRWGTTNGKIGFHGGKVAVAARAQLRRARSRAANLDSSPGKTGSGAGQ